MFSMIEKESFTYRDYVYPWYGELLGKLIYKNQWFSTGASLCTRVVTKQKCIKLSHFIAKYG